MFLLLILFLHLKNLRILSKIMVKSLCNFKIETGNKLVISPSIKAFTSSDFSFPEAKTKTLFALKIL